MGERNLVLFVIAACALSAVHAMLKPDDMGRKKYDHAVHRLTMEKWRGWREKNPEAFVMFYAPWCDHCRALKPRFAKVAAMAKEHSLMPLGAVDCTHNGHLCIDVDVPGYPTMKYFKDGADAQGTTYTGQRHVHDIYEYLESRGGSDTGGRQEL